MIKSNRIFNKKAYWLHLWATGHTACTSSKWFYPGRSSLDSAWATVWSGKGGTGDQRLLEQRGNYSLSCSFGVWWEQGSLWGFPWLPQPLQKERGTVELFAGNCRETSVLPHGSTLSGLPAAALPRRNLSPSNHPQLKLPLILNLNAEKLTVKQGILFSVK